MGCLNINVTRKRESIECGVTSNGEGIKAHFENIGEPIRFFVSDFAEHLKVRFSIVCLLDTIMKYLNVTPADVQ